MSAQGTNEKYPDWPAILTPPYSVKTQVAIVAFLSIFTFFVFGYADISGDSSRLFLTLATVQGSFLAIVVSVFILSQQVTASEYTPVTLRQMKDDLAVDFLILLFISSIVLDMIYYLEIGPWVTLDSGMNIEEASVMGLSVFCLLLLIPARKRVIQSVGPKEVLESTVAGIEGSSLPRENEEGLDAPPERNPLLAIDQVLQAAKRRDDEFTIRGAIFYMQRATVRIIEDGDLHNDGIDRQRFFEYWDSVIETAIEGPSRRGEIAARGLRNISIALIEKELSDAAEERVLNTEALYCGLIEHDNHDEELLYEIHAVNRAALEKDFSDVCCAICNSLSSQVTQLRETSNKNGTRESRITRSFGKRLLRLSISSVIVRANSGGTSDELEELISNQVDIHKEIKQIGTSHDGFIDEFTTGMLADRLAVLASACEQSNQERAAVKAFKLFVETALYSGDDTTDIQKRLSNANMSESTQRALVRTILVKETRYGLKPKDEIFEIDQEEYSKVYNEIIGRKSDDRPTVRY